MISSVFKPWLLTLCWTKGQAYRVVGIGHRPVTRVGGIWCRATSGVVGVHNRAVSGIWGVQHRAVNSVWGVPHRVMSGVWGVQHRAVNGVRRVQHRAVSRVWEIQHRTVSGVQSVQHRAVSGVRSVQHRAVSGVRSVQHRAVSGVRSVQHRAVSGVRSVQHRAVSGVWGVQYRPVSRICGVQHRAVSGVWGVQHRAVSGVWGVQHRTVSGLWGVQHRAVSGVWGLQHRAVSGVWGVQHRAVSGVWGVQHRAVSGAVAAGKAEEGKKVKTFDDLPGPSLLTSMYWLFLRGYVNYTHELQDIFKKKYGPLFKTSFGMYKAVQIADADLLETLLRQEGKYPMRLDKQPWKDYRYLRNLACGPLTAEGHYWYTLRSVLNKRMLKPAEAALYTGVINEVVTDFLSSLDVLRKETPSGVMVNDIANVLYRFTFEGISYILFETRIGCLGKQIPPESQKFIDTIGAMMKYTVYLSLLPVWTQNVLPYYRLYLETWDNIFEFGSKMIDQKMGKIQARLDRGEEVQGEYLTYLLSSGKLTDEEVNGSVVELLLAGVDTTSNTLCWALYHLARDPETQESLYQEVNDIVPGDAIPTAEDLAKMPLLKSVIKETLRLYPVSSANSRMNVEKDITLGGYWFPKNTLFVLNHYQMSHDENNFPQPNKFLPQRWLRENKVKNNPFSSIPFGYGVRACVGRRIAELEMYLTLSRIIKKYEIRPDPRGVEVSVVARAVLIPSRPINLQFLNRTNKSL